MILQNVPQKTTDAIDLNKKPNPNGTSTRQLALKLADGRVWSATNNQSHSSPAPDTQARGLIG